jgi:hypothetical protein
MLQFGMEPSKCIGDMFAVVEGTVALVTTARLLNLGLTRTTGAWSIA